MLQQHIRLAGASLKVSVEDDHTRASSGLVVDGEFPPSSLTQTPPSPASLRGCAGAAPAPCAPARSSSVVGAAVGRPRVRPSSQPPCGWRAPPADRLRGAAPNCSHPRKYEPRRGRQAPPNSLTQAPPLLRAFVVAPEQLSPAHRTRPRAPPSPQPPRWTATSPRRSAPRKLLAELLPPSLCSASSWTATSIPQGRVGRAEDCGRERPPFLRRAHPIPVRPPFSISPALGPRNVPWHSRALPRPPARELPAPGSGGGGANAGRGFR